MLVVPAKSIIPNNTSVLSVDLQITQPVPENVPDQVISLILGIKLVLLSHISPFIPWLPTELLTKIAG
jgi:hypothetical protein